MKPSQPSLFVKGLIQIILTCTILAIIASCDDEGTKKRQVQLARKDGESCLVDQKCKITVRRWEGAPGTCCGEQGNVYYRCLVTNEFYNNIGIEEKIVVDLNKCERISP